MSFALPQNNLTLLGLKVGDRVADFGAGTGAYSFAAAKAVGPDGKVFAVDVQKDLLQRLKEEARKQNLNNIDVVWGDIERVGGSGLGDHCVEAVILSNVLFQSKSTYTIALEVKRILRQNGRVLIIEWSESFGGIGPQPEDIITKDAATKAFGEAGFKVEKEFPAGDQHYGLILSK